MNLEVGTRLYHENLLKSPVAIDYLNSRGIQMDSIKKFLLGYAPGNRFLSDRVENIDYDSPLIRENGMDYFSNYIIFPIIVDEVVRSMTGRRITQENPKHLHLINTKKYIYNHDVIKNNETIFLVESPINAITLHQWGYAAVATLGATSFHKNHCDVLKEKKIYIGYDRDENKSGQKAALKTAEMLYLHNKIDSKLLVMPIGVDINDYAKTHSKKDFVESIISSAITYSSTKEFIKNRRKEKLRVSCPKLNLNKSDIEKVKVIPMKIVLDELGIKMNNYDKIICPLPDHEETEESFVVYEKTNTFKCFGCGEFGDNITLVRKICGLSFQDAIKLLKKIGGIK